MSLTDWSLSDMFNAFLAFVCLYSLVIYAVFEDCPDPRSSTLQGEMTAERFQRLVQSSIEHANSDAVRGWMTSLPPPPARGRTRRQRGARRARVLERRMEYISSRLTARVLRSRLHSRPCVGNTIWA